MKQASVTISPYDPQWPDIFEREKSFLKMLAAEWLHGSIEHVGSTVVPGLAAKPVIDIMFGVESLDQSRAAIDVTQNNGYQYFPYKQHVMHWFCKPSASDRTHHLHLVPYQGSLWQERIRFREILITHPEVANEYSMLKQALAKRYEHDRESYTEAKWPFIERTLATS